MNKAEDKNPILKMNGDDFIDFVWGIAKNDAEEISNNVMNKAWLESEKYRLEWERRKIDNELSSILDDLRKLEILAKVIDECDNGAGHYYKQLWTDQQPSGDTESRLLCTMANNGLLRVRDYGDKVVAINHLSASSARFTITPKGRAVLAESEKESIPNG